MSGTYNNARTTYNGAAVVGATVPTVAIPPPKGPGKKAKPFCCSNKHPVGALKTLRPDALFDLVCQYATPKGSALVYTTTIDGVVYQGEGTSASIAKSIAATKALGGLNAMNHHLLQKVADYEEQKKEVVERIQIWQEGQDLKEEKRKAKEEREATREDMKEEKRKAKEEREAKENESEHANKRKKENNGDGTPMITSGERQMDYGYLKQRYGPDITEVIAELEEKNSTGCFMYKCVLTVQGTVFEAQFANKKGAKRLCVAEAIAALELNPPPVVNERKHKTAKKRAEYKPIEPETFQDQLAEKCWNFVTEKTAELLPPHKTRRNLVVIVKVEGQESLENCEIVTFGSGSLLVKKENMSSDGTVINDCTGESLALRALRRYLLDQIELCLSNKLSVYVKERASSKCSLKKMVSFYMYTNSSPMGDCRAVSPEPENLEPNPTPMEAESTSQIKQESESTPQIKQELQTPMDTDKPIKKRPFNGPRRFRVYSVPEEDHGKITFAKTDEEDGSSEFPMINDPEICHCIVSPSDKLAVRQMCGVQGSVLFNLTNAIYISHYFVNRSYHEQALARALYSRVKDAKMRGAANVGLEPKTAHVTWKASRMPERRSMFALIWAKDHSVEVIFSREGKQVNKDNLTETLEVNEIKDLNILATSDYCTKSLYTAMSSVCSKNKKPFAQKYSAIKSANTRYRSTKAAVLAHLKDTGMGSWSENPMKPKY